MNQAEENILDVGDIPLSECDGANIPVNIFVSSLDPEHTWDGTYYERGYRWVLRADNFMPRRGACSDGVYHVYAKTREELVAYMHKHVTPWYEAAAKHLYEARPDKDGSFSLYYWPSPKTQEA